MRCDVAQRELSVAMDDLAPTPPEVEEHARGCPRCTAFLEGAWRVRKGVRIEPSPPVPDLVPAIMARVREEQAAGRPRLVPWTLDIRRRGRPSPMRRPVAAALVAGLVAGFLLSGGLFPRGSSVPSALAQEIPDRLVHAAVGLQGYRATFDITERHWSPQVPVRTFVARIAFRAPERFLATVRDTTRYPSTAWPRNDLTLVTNGRTWRAVGPDPCPAAAATACPGSSPAVHTVTGRPPFDAQTALPTDVIVPMTVLAAQDRVRVVRPDVVADRSAVEVALPYQDARPLFTYLQFLGSWRSFYAQDRVALWLDRRTWFPLRYQVFPAPGPERALWAAQMGFPKEPPDRPVFTATVRSLSEESPSPSDFALRTGVRLHTTPVDRGFRDVPIRDLAGRPGTWIQPADTVGLQLTRAGRFANSVTAPFRESITAYSSGLAWATLTRVTGWNQRRLFGVGDFAEPVAVGHGSVAYYEPATAQSPRRVALHSSVGEFLVATNLPRLSLLRIAGSLPVDALPEPGSWQVHRWSGGVVRNGLTPSDAVNEAEFPVLLPEWVPPGYRAAAAQLVKAPTVEGVTIVFRRQAAELDGVGIRLYQARGQTLPPPESGTEEAVLVRGTLGRWSADDHLLEWVESGVYRSLSAPGQGLSSLLRVARSLRSPAGT
jgi:hypothetical protein